MCGVWGALSSSTLSPEVDKFLKNAAVAGTLRGSHSTGVAIFTKDKKGNNYHEIRKAAINGVDFVDICYDPTFENGSAYSVIGHNRFATMGTINDESAHPFKNKDVIGVHNGTLRGTWRSGLDCPKSTPIDSMGLMHSIMHRGYKKTFESVSGAIATVWCNTRTDRTYVYRNNERPLYYVKTVSGALLYASESGMLSWLMERNKILKIGDIKSFDIDTVYEITDGVVKELEKVQTVQDYQDFGHYYQAPGMGMNYGLTPYKYRTTDYLEGEIKEEEPLKNLVLVEGENELIPHDDLYGPSDPKDYMRVLGYNLPVVVNFSFSDSVLRDLGYRVQSGVYYRGLNVTDYERDRGIIAEYAEHSTAPAALCSVSGKLLPDEYLESSCGTVTIATPMLDSWVASQGTNNSVVFYKIIRRNENHYVQKKVG